MLEHKSNAYIRGIGLLYLRLGLADGYKSIWSWFEPYLSDEMRVDVQGAGGDTTGRGAAIMTFGEYATRLLTNQDYFGDRLPRIPTGVQRQIDAALAARRDGGGGGGGLGAAGVVARAHERATKKRAEVEQLELKVRDIRRRIGEQEQEAARLRGE